MPATRSLGLPAHPSLTTTVRRKLGARVVVLRLGSPMEHMGLAASGSRVGRSCLLSYSPRLPVVRGAFELDATRSLPLGQPARSSFFTPTKGDEECAVLDRLNVVFQVRREHQQLTTSEIYDAIRQP
jgi:hypothetical protein